MNVFFQSVFATIQKYQMFKGGERVLVAFSGGPDSTALLHALYALAPEWEGQLVVAHFNHGLRADADRVEALCRRVVDDFGLPFIAGRSSTLQLGGSNLEARARSERYRFLQLAAQQAACAKIATAHTMTDQAETVLLRLVRGTGVSGLKGILPVRRDGVVRPLIERTRQEVLGFLRQHQIGFDDDEMNRDRRFARNRIRSEVLPLLERLNPQVVASLARLASLARRHDSALHALLEEKMRTLLDAEGRICIRALRATPTPLRGALLRAWLGEVHESGKQKARTLCHWDALVAHAGRGDDRFLSREEAWALLRGQAPKERAGHFPYEWTSVPFAGPGRLALPGGLTAEVEVVGAFQRSQLRHRLACAREWIAAFDAENPAAATAWRFRPARPGDRIEPIGMAQSKKLQDIFVDRKVPRSLRWGRPVLVCGDTLLWVPGVVRSRHFLLPERGTQCLWIEVSPRRFAAESGV